MAQRELDRCARARGDPDDVDLVVAEVIEQFGEDVGLGGDRGLGGHHRPEISEAGRDDDPSVRQQVAYRQQSTVAALEDAVAHQDRLTRAACRVFDSATP